MYFHIESARLVLGRKANDALATTLSAKTTEVAVLPVRDEALDGEGLMLNARPVAASA